MSEFSYCLNTSTIRPTPLLEKIRVAGEAGFDAIEPWYDEVVEFLSSGGTVYDVRAALGDAGLKVVSMIALHGWIFPPGVENSPRLDDCKRRMELASALGCPYIVASPPQEQVDLELAADCFGQLMRLGDSIGVRPSMEFLGFVEGVNSVASAWAIAAKCGEPGATVVADVFHMVRGGGSVDDLLSLRGDKLSCFHINDLPAKPEPLVQTDADRVMLGEGVADLPRVVHNLRAIGYRGPLSLELFNRSLWRDDPATVAATGLARLKALAESPEA